MGRMYTIQVAAAAITTATDLFEITAATDKPVRIWGWHIYQTTDLGDAAEEVLAVTLERGVTAGSGGATAGTPEPIVKNDAAAGFTANKHVTTAHTNGTVIARRGWNIRLPDDFWFTPETAPVTGADDDPVTLTISAPADSVTYGGMMYVEELA